MYEQCETDDQDEPSVSDPFELPDEDPFETRAIFSLADFLKSLSPNEYYDIAQKIFVQFEESRMPKVEKAAELVAGEHPTIEQKLKRMCRAF